MKLKYLLVAVAAVAMFGAVGASAAPTCYGTNCDVTNGQICVTWQNTTFATKCYTFEVYKNGSSTPCATLEQCDQPSTCVVGCGSWTQCTKCWTLPVGSCNLTGGDSVQIKVLECGDGNCWASSGTCV